MKLVVNIADYVKEQVDAGKGEELGIPTWLVYEIAKGTPLPKGHGRLKDVDKFLEKVKKDKEHEIYLHSWTADMVLERLDSWYAPTIIEAEKEE